MTEQGSIEALSAASRVTDPDYPGVLAAIGSDWRLAVNMDCSRYLLQRRGQSDDGEMWHGHNAATLSALIDRHGFKVDGDGLIDACEGLPDNPAQAAPVFAARRAALMADFEANDWRLQGYARSIAQDGNVRLVVDPSGAEYQLQWVSTAAFKAGPCDDWRVLVRSDSLTVIRDYIRHNVFDVTDKARAVCGDLLRAMDQFPELVSDGLWPALPVRPATVHK